MKISLFVEGQSDHVTLPILARKISRNSSFVTRVLSRGDLLNADKVSAYIEMDIKSKHPDVNKIIVCPDSECTPEKEFLHLVQPIQSKLGRLVATPRVYYCGVIHATEAWLACDCAALGKYLGGTSIKESVAQAIANSCKPKEALRALFSRHGRDFSNVRDNPLLAAGVNANQLARVSKSFAKFAELILKG